MAEVLHNNGCSTTTPAGWTGGCQPLKCYTTMVVPRRLPQSAQESVDSSKIRVPCKRAYRHGDLDILSFMYTIIYGKEIGASTFHCALCIYRPS